MGAFRSLYETTETTLGEGAYGKVVLSKNKATGEAVAAKRVLMSFIHRLQMLSQLKTECKQHQRAQHDNVVRLIEIFDDPVSTVLVLEYMPGGDLRTYVGKHRGYALPEPEAAHIMSQVVEAMDCIHGLGIAHRDLKKDNVLLDFGGKSSFPIAKVSDFGWCGELTNGRAPPLLCGSRLYWPPELWLHQEQSIGVDKWMVGCLLFELLAGYPPFAADGDAALKKQVLDGSPSFPTWVSKEAAACVAAFLEKHPEQRCATHPWLDRRPRA